MKVRETERCVGERTVFIPDAYPTACKVLRELMIKELIPGVPAPTSTDRHSSAADAAAAGAARARRLPLPLPRPRARPGAAHAARAAPRAGATRAGVGVL